MKTEFSENKIRKILLGHEDGKVRVSRAQKHLPVLLFYIVDNDE